MNLEKAANGELTRATTCWIDCYNDVFAQRNARARVVSYEVHVRHFAVHECLDICRWKRSLGRVRADTHRLA
jgi:hypothetical protein